MQGAYGMMQSAQTGQTGGARIFGFPLEGFGFFSGMLLALASAFFTFFATTLLAIFGLLVWNQILGHSVDYADTYLYVGLPAGVVVLVIAVPFFLFLWVRARVRQ